MSNRKTPSMTIHGLGHPVPVPKVTAWQWRSTEKRHPISNIPTLAYRSVVPRPAALIGLDSAAAWPSHIPLHARTVSSLPSPSRARSKSNNLDTLNTAHPARLGPLSLTSMLPRHAYPPFTRNNIVDQGITSSHLNH